MDVETTLVQLGTDLGLSVYTWLDGWGDPYWWHATAAVLVCCSAIGWWPLTPDRLHDSGQAFVCLIRRLLFTLAGSLLMLFPIALWGAYALMNQGDMAVGLEKLLGWYAYGATLHWPLVLVATFLGVGVHFIAAPHLLATWSSITKLLRVRPKADRKSDVRDEHGRFRTLDFDPMDYYRLDDGLLFVGLQENGEPHYWKIKDFRERHVEVIGSTGSGKGCFLQTLLDQIIRLDWGVFVTDPKWDKQVPHVLQAVNGACIDTGRSFIFHDLNEDGGMVWEPFAGSPGSLREHNVARLVAAWRLNDVADNSAVYKADERDKVEEFARQRNTGLSLLHMAREIESQERDDREHNRFVKVRPRYITGVKEWVKRKAFTQRQGVKPFRVARTIEDNAVVYCRGSLSDHLVQDAMRIMIVEYLQEIERLSVSFPPGYHFVMVIDEVPQVLCDHILRALRTMRTFSCTLILLYQSEAEIRTLKVADVNGENAVATFHENCQFKLLYGTIDEGTAEWSALQTGTVTITTEARESTAQAGRGAAWQGDVTYQQEEVSLIPANVFLQLPPRVGAALAQGELARIVRTCYVTVPTDKQLRLPPPPVPQAPELLQAPEPAKQPESDSRTDTPADPAAADAETAQSPPPIKTGKPRKAKTRRKRTKVTLPA